MTFDDWFEVLLLKLTPHDSNLAHYLEERIDKPRLEQVFRAAFEAAKLEGMRSGPPLVWEWIECVQMLYTSRAHVDSILDSWSAELCDHLFQDRAIIANLAFMGRMPGLIRYGEHGLHRYRVTADIPDGAPFEGLKPRFGVTKGRPLPAKVSKKIRAANRKRGVTLVPPPTPDVLQTWGETDPTIA